MEIQKLKETVKMLKKDENVLAIMLFGSAARGQLNPMSDIDICVFFKKNALNKYKMSEKRFKYLIRAPSKFDIQIFQLLPLYIRTRVLKEGKILYCKNMRQLYEIAYETIQNYNFFKSAYEDYIRVNKLVATQTPLYKVSKNDT